MWRHGKDTDLLLGGEVARIVMLDPAINRKSGCSIEERGWCWTVPLFLVGCDRPGLPGSGLSAASSGKVNLTGAIHTAQAAARIMSRQEPNERGIRPRFSYREHGETMPWHEAKTMAQELASM